MAGIIPARVPISTDTVRISVMRWGGTIISRSGKIVMAGMDV